MRTPASTHSWYQGFSGAMTAYLRGLFLRSPPAHAAGLRPRRASTHVDTLSVMIEQSVATLHEYGRRCVNHSRERYGAPKFTTWRWARASAYGTVPPLSSAKALISSDTFTASACASS